MLAVESKQHEKMRGSRNFCGHRLDHFLLVPHKSQHSHLQVTKVTWCVILAAHNFWLFQFYPQKHEAGAERAVQHYARAEASPKSRSQD